MGRHAFPRVSDTDPHTLVPSTDIKITDRDVLDEIGRSKRDDITTSYLLLISSIFTTAFFRRTFAIELDFDRVCHIGKRHASCQDSDIDVKRSAIIICHPGSCDYLRSAGSMHLCTRQNCPLGSHFMKRIRIC